MLISRCSACRKAENSVMINFMQGILKELVPIGLVAYKVAFYAGNTQGNWSNEILSYPLPSCHPYFYSMSVVMVVHGVLRQAAMRQGRGKHEECLHFPTQSINIQFLYGSSNTFWAWSLSKMALKHRRVIKHPRLECRWDIVRSVVTNST